MRSYYWTLRSMVEDCKEVSRIICRECGERPVCGVHFWKPISLFADVFIWIYPKFSYTMLEYLYSHKLTLHYCQLKETILYWPKVVLATGPGNVPAVRVLTGGSVQFGSVPDPAQNPTCFVLAGLLPGPDIEPQVFDWVGNGLQFQIYGSYSFRSN